MLVRPDQAQPLAATGRIARPARKDIGCRERPASTRRAFEETASMPAKSANPLRLWSAAAGFALAALGLSPAGAAEKVLRAVMHADVRTLDPFWTTQTIAGIHGMIVYDTLFGNDEDGRAHPQMVGKYTVSEDRKTYEFTLRDGL